MNFRVCPKIEREKLRDAKWAGSYNGVTETGDE